MAGVVVQRGSELGNVIEDDWLVEILKIVLLIVDRREIRARERLLGLYRGILLMRREDLGVTVHVATAAGRHFKYVHVESQLLVPSQQSVIIVDLHAGGTIVFGDK